MWFSFFALRRVDNIRGTPGTQALQCQESKEERKGRIWQDSTVVEEDAGSPELNQRMPVLLSVVSAYMDTWTPNVCKMLAFGALLKVSGHSITDIGGPGRSTLTKTQTPCHHLRAVGARSPDP